MSARPVYLGIDLGTTNSAAALFDGQRVELVRSAQGGTLTPSVVRIDGRGGVTVGARARRFLDGDPRNTATEFKRLMGTAQAIEFPASGQRRRPEELAAEVLRQLRADARDQLGFEPGATVVTVPALFELPQSAATSEAARLAGFERTELLQEPIASALAAGWSRDDEGLWLIYDLGGGTFDASLLESKDGLLRVVGHDGDNFLGGRDLDLAILDWAIARLAERGVTLERAEPRHAAALRKLRHAAEEAKLELGRAEETSLTLPELEVDGAPVEVDLTLGRATLEALAQPLVDRSLEVCRRLLRAHEVNPERLARVVLVGGPTAMPLVRRRVAEALPARLADTFDPMTLVAQGAAIYAATAGLDARPPAPPPPSARRLWLQYPPMSSDLTPHVVGRLVEGGGGPAPVRLRLVRHEEPPAAAWASEDTPLDAEGGFVIGVELRPRQSNLFRVEARAADGTPVVVDPSAITIVQGLTVSDPPLSRGVGVALASDRVRVYFERGTPLPARRTFVHHAVESVARGVKDSGLRIPIVQGEYEQAHLCRLVGALEITGADLPATLPAGAPVEVTIELDRGGRLSARALLPTIQHVVERVAHLLVPDADPETLEAGARALQDRLSSLRTDAFRRGDARSVSSLADAERVLAEAAADARAARGGDADAGQKARRLLLELDARLESVEEERRWPELEERARQRVATAASWVSMYGTPEEQRLLAEATRAVERSRAERQARELERQLRVVRSLADAAYFRDPDAWGNELDWAASQVASATDLPQAEGLVREGRRARERGDQDGLRRAVQRLWQLLPGDPQERRLGHDSGVR